MGELASSWVRLRSSWRSASLVRSVAGLSRSRFLPSLIDFEGERLRGNVLQPSGDWITVRPNGSMKLDVRIVLSTDDGASIYMAYFGS